MGLVYLPAQPDLEFKLINRRLASRRLKGFARNFANQLVQMAVGWEVMADGPAPLNQPDIGVVEINAVSASGTVNGKPREL